MTYLIRNYRTGQFIYGGLNGHKVVQELENATQFTTIVAAANFYKTNLSHVASVGNLDDWSIISKNAAMEKTLDQVVAASEAQATELAEKAVPVRHTEAEVGNALAEVAEIQRCIETIAEKHAAVISVLSGRLSWLDKAQQDILHKAEDVDLSAVEGFKLYKMLQALRKKRRSVKNSLATISILRPEDRGRLLVLANAMKRLAQKQADPHYTPRQMPELFEQTGIGNPIDF